MWETPSTLENCWHPSSEKNDRTAGSEPTLEQTDLMNDVGSCIARRVGMLVFSSHYEEGERRDSEHVFETILLLRYRNRFPIELLAR